MTGPALRKLALIAMLSILQAAPPAPRPAIKNHTDKSGTETQIPKNRQETATPLTPSVAAGTPTKADGTAQSTKGNAEITDPSTPKYEPWRRADKLSLAYDILTGLLVIIGGLGVCFAIRTLRAIEGQTNVLAESQRPRIIADAGDDPSKTFTDESARRVKLRVTNKGIMPATEYLYESWIEILPDTSGDFTSAADHFKCETISVLHPNASQFVNIPLRTEISQAEFFAVKRLQKYVCVRLYVEYDDPFLPDRRCYADFGFYLIPGGLGFLDKHNRIGHKNGRSISSTPNLNRRLKLGDHP